MLLICRSIPKPASEIYQTLQRGLWSFHLLLRWTSMFSCFAWRNATCETLDGLRISVEKNPMFLGMELLQNVGLGYIHEVKGLRTFATSNFGWLDALLMGKILNSWTPKRLVILWDIVVVCFKMVNCMACTSTVFLIVFFQASIVVFFFPHLSWVLFASLPLLSNFYLEFVNRWALQ